MFCDSMSFVESALRAACHDCATPFALDFESVRQSGHITVKGYKVSVDLKCPNSKCKKVCHVINYQTTSDGVTTSTFTNSLPVIPLAAGVGPADVTKIALLFGVTRQPDKRRFTEKITSNLRDEIEKCADASARKALEALIHRCRELGMKQIPVCFDAAWDHRRNANNCVGRFIAGIDVPGYDRKPVVCQKFAMKSRFRRGEDNEGIVGTVMQGNFDGSSKQMEHFILEEILDENSEFFLMLEKERMDGEDAFILEIVIDGDLDSLKSLGLRGIKVYVDYSHQKKNLKKRIEKDDVLKVYSSFFFHF